MLDPTSAPPSCMEADLNMMTLRLRELVSQAKKSIKISGSAEIQVSLIFYRVCFVNKKPNVGTLAGRVDQSYSVKG